MFSLLKLELSRELERERTADGQRQELRRRAMRTRWRTAMPDRIDRKEQS